VRIEAACRALAEFLDKRGLERTAELLVRVANAALRTPRAKEAQAVLALLAA
jgi:hypothetical protein